MYNMPPRILLSDLYNLKEKKDHVKYKTFDNIIEICHKKIKHTATIGRGMNIFYEIPYYMYGKPLYKIADCIEYIVSALRKNGLYVQILPEPNTNMLYISWNPSEISSNIKSLGYTGKI
jgi:hypothetical protein